MTFAVTISTNFTLSEIAYFCGWGQFISTQFHHTKEKLNHWKSWILTGKLASTVAHSRELLIQLAEFSYNHHVITHFFRIWARKERDCEATAWYNIKSTKDNGPNKRHEHISSILLLVSFSITFSFYYEIPKLVTHSLQPRELRLKSHSMEV